MFVFIISLLWIHYVHHHCMECVWVITSSSSTSTINSPSSESRITLIYTRRCDDGMNKKNALLSFVFFQQLLMIWWWTNESYCRRLLCEEGGNSVLIELILGSGIILKIFKTNTEVSERKTLERIFNGKLNFDIYKQIKIPKFLRLQFPISRMTIFIHEH